MLVAILLVVSLALALLRYSYWYHLRGDITGLGYAVLFFAATVIMFAQSCNVPNAGQIAVAISAMFAFGDAIYNNAITYKSSFLIFSVTFGILPYLNSSICTAGLLGTGLTIGLWALFVLSVTDRDGETKLIQQLQFRLAILRGRFRHR